MSGSSTPSIETFILEFLVNWRWVLFHLLHRVDPAKEAQYAQLFVDARAMASVLSGSLASITTVGAMPFGALDMARCGFYHLLIAEDVLECTPPTLHPFLCAVSGATPGSGKESSINSQSNEGLNTSARSTIDPRRVESITEDGAFRTERRREEAYAQAMGVLLRWITRPQLPDGSAILEAEELMTTLNMTLSSAKQRVVAPTPVSAERHLCDSSHPIDGREKTSPPSLFVLLKEASRKLSQLVPFYLGAHAFITRSLLHHYTRTVLSIESVMTHTRHLLCRDIPQVHTVEGALMGWMRTVVKLLADAPDFANEQHRQGRWTLKTDRNTNGNLSLTSGDASNALPVLQTRDWVIWRQAHLYRDKPLAAFLYSGVVLSAVLYFYHPTVVALEKVELVELAGGLPRKNERSVKPGTGLPSAAFSFERDESGEDDATEGSSAVVGAVERNWDGLLRGLGQLGVWAGLTAKEVARHGRGGLALHLLRLSEAVFAAVATRAEEAVRATVEWELTEELTGTIESDTVASQEAQEGPPQEVQESAPEAQRAVTIQRLAQGHGGVKSDIAEDTFVTTQVEKDVLGNRLSSPNCARESTQVVTEPALPAAIAPVAETPAPPLAPLSLLERSTDYFDSLGSPKHVSHTAPRHHHSIEEEKEEEKEEGEVAAPLSPPSSVAFAEDSDSVSTSEEDGSFRPHVLSELYQRTRLDGTQSASAASPSSVSMKTLKESQFMGSAQDSHYTADQNVVSGEDLRCLQLSPPPPLSKLEDRPQKLRKTPVPASDGVEDELNAHPQLTDDGAAPLHRATIPSPEVSSYTSTDHPNSVTSSTSKVPFRQDKDQNNTEISRTSEVMKDEEHSLTMPTTESNYFSVHDTYNVVQYAEEDKLIELLESQVRNSVELPSRRFHDRSPPRSEEFYTEDPAVGSSTSSKRSFEMSEGESVICFTVASSVKQSFCKDATQKAKSGSKEKKPSIEGRHLDLRSSAEWDFLRVQGAPIPTSNGPKSTFSPLSIDKCTSEANFIEQVPDSCSSMNKSPIAESENLSSYRRTRKTGATILMPPSPEPGDSRALIDTKRGQTSDDNFFRDGNGGNVSQSHASPSRRDVRRIPRAQAEEQREEHLSQNQSVTACPAGQATSPQQEVAKFVDPAREGATCPPIHTVPGSFPESQSSKKKSAIDAGAKRCIPSYNAHLTSKVSGSCEQMHTSRTSDESFRKSGANYTCSMTCSNNSLESGAARCDSASAQLAETDASSCNDLDSLQDTSTENFS